MSTPLPDTDMAQLMEMYSEVGQTWRHFAGWREKIIAGYLTSIAAIATALHVSEIDWIALLLAAVVISVAFWIFDLRNRILLGVCQRSGKSIEEALWPLLQMTSAVPSVVPIPRSQTCATLTTMIGPLICSRTDWPSTCPFQRLSPVH
jgi:hypothetical protein